MLNILEGFDLAAMGRDSTDFWHLMIEAKKIAYEDRARYYADMSFADVPVEALLDKELRRRAGEAHRYADGPPKPSNPATPRSTTATPPSWSRPMRTA